MTIASRTGEVFTGKSNQIYKLNDPIQIVEERRFCRNWRVRDLSQSNTVVLRRDWSLYNCLHPSAYQQHRSCLYHGPLFYPIEETILNPFRNFQHVHTSERSSKLYIRFAKRKEQGMNKDGKAQSRSVDMTFVMQIPITHMRMALCAHVYNHCMSFNL